MDKISMSICLVIISFKVLFVLVVHIKCKGSSQKRQLVGKLLSMRGEISENCGGKPVAPVQTGQWFQFQIQTMQQQAFNNLYLAGLNTFIYLDLICY